MDHEYSCCIMNTHTYKQILYGLGLSTYTWWDPLVFYKKTRGLPLPPPKPASSPPLSFPTPTHSLHPSPKRMRWSWAGKLGSAVGWGFWKKNAVHCSEEDHVPLGLFVVWGQNRRTDRGSFSLLMYGSRSRCRRCHLEGNISLMEFVGLALGSLHAAFALCIFSCGLFGSLFRNCLHTHTLRNVCFFSSRFPC